MSTDGGRTTSGAGGCLSSVLLVGHRMRNLPTMTVLAEHSEHRNGPLCTCCLLYGGYVETARLLGDGPAPLGVPSAVP